MRIGPMALAELWPCALLADVRTANRDTLFFAHLLTPHYPYVYRADGSLRTPHEWASDDRLGIGPDDRKEYQARYERYGEQVRYVNRQIAGLLAPLRASGHYDSATIIIHGDHGSRIQLLKKGTGNAASRNDEDGQIEPDERDLPNLLSRFATLLALKLPDSAGPEFVREKAGVLFFLRRDLLSMPVQDAGLNSVYVFDSAGALSAIPLARLWTGNGSEPAAMTDLNRTQIP
jgi:arylsulfatase A-like enzyme